MKEKKEPIKEYIDNLRNMMLDKEKRTLNPIFIDEKKKKRQFK